MSRRDEYLVAAGTPVDDVLVGDVAAAYDAGYQHGADDAGSLVAVLADMPGVDVVSPSSAPGYAAAIADALRVLDEKRAKWPGDRAQRILADAAARIAALAPAEPPPLTERARWWADSLVHQSVNAHTKLGLGIDHIVLALAVRDPDIVAAINEAARRLRGAQ